MIAGQQRWVAALRAGEVLACPTETQMGLLADALSEAAVRRVCELKRRPLGEPIPLIVPSLAVAEQLVGKLPALARALAERHWPGPLTLVLPAAMLLPAPLLRDGKLGLRVPGPSPALELVTAFGGPLTATSANLSGQAPLASALELRASFGAALFDVVPGAAPGGPPSTVVDISGSRARVLRSGAIQLAQGELGC
jgi:L-threonylcarbamoyladenylate synthase